MPTTSPNFQPCRPRQKGNETFWRLWAPLAREVHLDLRTPSGNDRRLPMERGGDGYFTLLLKNVAVATRYGYSLEGGPTRPDPATVFQPSGVHDLSGLFFPETCSWKHSSPVIERSDLVLYELHLGTFTREGTFDAALERIPDLVDLGINAVEILPVAQFPGERNWGYDGVHPMATQHSYGGPAAFQRFIDAAHELGLSVFLDVVFNHLGPEGNYLSEFAPYFTERHPTPWGPGFNFDGDDAQPVRDWILECVWQWIHDFRLDGLRLDAVHVMVDSSPVHILTDIKKTANTAAESRGGKAIIIAESLLNDPKMITPTEAGGLGLDAEWNEDFHHAVSAWMTGETHGKYVDYQGIETIRNVINNNLHLTGQHSEFYGQKWGKPSPEVESDRFVISLQNHDHVGNRACGERFASLVSPGQMRLGACLTILSPFLPMLFMGEEYGETNPFLFFCSFGDAGVVKGVRRGRKRDYGLQGEVPDPQAESSFATSRLSWDWEDQDRASLRQLYQDLIALRKAHLELRSGTNRGAVELNGESGRELLLLERGALRCYFNLSPEVAALPEGEVIWRSEEEGNSIEPFESLVVRPEET